MFVNFDFSWFFRGHQHFFSRIFVGISLYKSLEKSERKKLVTSKKSRKKQNFLKLSIFSIIIILHKYTLKFSSPNSKLGDFGQGFSAKILEICSYWVSGADVFIFCIHFGRAVHDIFRKITSKRWTVGYLNLAKKKSFPQKWTNWS